MSRIANNPITIPSGVDVKIDGNQVTVKGNKGMLNHTIHPSISVKKEEDTLITGTELETKAAVALAGTTRALLQNIVTGVSKGYERKLEIIGVGYRAQVQGKSLNLTLGFSHPVDFSIPEGITIETPSQTEIVIKGIDKQKVGQVAANIRAYRPPEPYKGKGIRYVGEQVKIKPGKAATK